MSLGGRLATPLNVIVHTLQDVNDQLAQGRPFFVDIARDGIVLHEMPGFPFVVPKRSRRRSGVSRLLGTSSGGFRVPVTLLNTRAIASPMKCERCCVSPASGHRTAVPLRPSGPDALQSQAPPLDPPAVTGRERRCPTDPSLAARHEVRPPLLCPPQPRLRRRRYSPHYEITLEELAWLVERVSALQDIVAAICTERLAIPDSGEHEA